GALETEVAIAFDLPDDPAMANRLGETPVRCRELPAEPGVDLSTTFVLPVYAPVAAAVPA
ncbi:MAG: hypothetical protein L6Q95_17690, partial [Planctomycetes bacterium]|nr:hypothetical protein [Planctomycetota bacterium]